MHTRTLAHSLSFVYENLFFNMHRLFISYCKQSFVMLRHLSEVLAQPTSKLQGRSHPLLPVWIWSSIIRRKPLWMDNPLSEQLRPAIGLQMQLQWFYYWCGKRVPRPRQRSQVIYCKQNDIFQSENISALFFSLLRHTKESNEFS